MMTSSNGNICPFVKGKYRVPVDFPHKGRWRWALMFSLICAPKNRLIKQSRRRWFETPSYSLWRHCNDHRKNQRGIFCILISFEACFGLLLGLWFWSTKFDFYLHLLPVVAILVVWGFIRKPTSVSIIELSKIFHVTNKHKRLAFTEMFQPFKSVQLTTETQDGHHFADEIFMQFLDRKCLYLYSNVTEISSSSPWRFGHL